MGNETKITPGLTIVAEPLCTSAAELPPIEVSLASEEQAAAPSTLYSAAASLFASSPLQSLIKQTQLFSSAKDVLDPSDSKDPVPMACSSVTVSGSGNFGDVNVGYSSNRSISISNPCDCPVNYFVAGAPYGFSLSSSGGTIPAHGSASISVTFMPQSEQNYSGSISITPGGSSVYLSGRGVRR